MGELLVDSRARWPRSKERTRVAPPLQERRTARSRRRPRPRPPAKLLLGRRERARQIPRAPPVRRKPRPQREEPPRLAGRGRRERLRSSSSSSRGRPRTARLRTTTLDHHRCTTIQPTRFTTLQGTHIARATSSTLCRLAKSTSTGRCLLLQGKRTESEAARTGTCFTSWGSRHSSRRRRGYSRLCPPWAEPHLSCPTRLVRSLPQHTSWTPLFCCLDSWASSRQRRGWHTLTSCNQRSQAECSPTPGCLPRHRRSVTRVSKDIRIATCTA